jgi:tetratricopeptide (TPR) repeat protein
MTAMTRTTKTEVDRLMEQGVACAGAGQFAEAEQAYRRATELAPGNPWPWVLLGGVLQEHLQRPLDAAAAYRRALALDPELEWVRDRLAAFDDEREIEAAVEVPATAVAAVADEAWEQVTLAKKHYEPQGRYDEAEAAYRRAISINPRYAMAWAFLGDLLRDHGERYEEAEAAYRKVSELDPHNAWPWARLAELLHDRLGRYGEAEAGYRHALEIAPDDSWLHGKLGQLLHEDLARPEEAEEHYRKAIRLRPDAWLWTQLALLLQQFGRSTEAEQACRRAIALDPDHAAAWGVLGLALSATEERRGAAERSFRKAIALKPDYGWAWGQLGILLHEVGGRLEEAQTALRRSLEIAPRQAWVAGALAGCWIPDLQTRGKPRNGIGARSKSIRTTRSR